MILRFMVVIVFSCWWLYSVNELFKCFKVIFDSSIVIFILFLLGINCFFSVDICCLLKFGLKFFKESDSCWLFIC